MLTTPEQFVAAQKAQLDSIFGLSQKAFDGAEKLVALNLQLARAALGEAAEATTAAMSAKDPQSFAALQQAYLQPAAEKSAAYGRQVYDIVSATSAEFGKVAEEAVADVQAKMLALVDTAVKNAPAGSENAVSLVKATVSAANDAFESAQKAAKQAASVVEANFNTMAATATKAMSDKAPAKSRKAA